MMSMMYLFAVGTFIGRICTIGKNVLPRTTLRLRNRLAWNFDSRERHHGGTFHDVKAECLTPDAYDRAAPIFLHRVDRGSGVFEFLAQFDPLITWVVALGAAAKWYQNLQAADQEFDEKRLTFIRSNFPEGERR